MVIQGFNNSSQKNVEVGITPVNEVYFGRNKDIDEAIGYLGKLRSKYSTDNPDNTDVGLTYMKNDINIDPDLLKFNRKMEDIFGFGTFCLSIDPAYIKNAYTIPLGKRMFSKSSKTIDATKDGWKFDKEDDYCCLIWMYYGIVMDSTFTDEEIFAIILHEVGHNFSSGMDRTVELTSLITQILTIPSIVMMLTTSPSIEAYRFASTFTNKLAKDYVKKNKRLVAKGGFTNTIKKTFKYMYMNIVTTGSEIGQLSLPILLPLAFPMMVAQKIRDLINPINLLDLLSGKKDEKLSDEFATSYGFGAELASGLTKMEKSFGGMRSLQSMHKIPILGHMYDLLTIPFTTILSLFDIHPSTGKRIATQLSYLKSELNSSKVDPKMVKRLTSDINQIESALELIKDDVNTAKGSYFKDKQFDLQISASNLINGNTDSKKLTKLYERLLNEK